MRNQSFGRTGRAFSFLAFLLTASLPLASFAEMMSPPAWSDAKPTPTPKPYPTRDTPERENAEVKFPPLYFDLMAGYAAAHDPASGDTNRAFDFGVRLGGNVAQIGDFSKLAVGMSYDSFSLSDRILPAASGPAGSDFTYHTLSIEVIFRDVAGTGFYFGPQLGFGILTSYDSDNFNQNSSTTYVFEAGGIAGWRFHVINNYFIGPEVWLAHYGPGSLSGGEVTGSLGHSVVFKGIASLGFQL